MATSKAERAKQWRQAVYTAGPTRRVAAPVWSARMRWRTRAKSGSVTDNGSELHRASSNKRVRAVIRPTSHALRRMAQRNLSEEEISFVLLHGQAWHKAGAVITHLRRKDIPQADRGRQELIGATVVIEPDNRQTVLTVYRNRRAGLGKIKRKPDYGWNSQLG